MSALPQNTVLILTHSGDRFVIERVGTGLERRGCHWVRFDTDLYPSRVGLDWSIDGREQQAALVWNTPPEQAPGASIQSLPLKSLRAIWARKLWTPKLPAGLAAPIAEGCQREIRATLLGTLLSIEQVPWVNPYPATQRAEDKLYQLRLATSHGLSVPPSLCSNRPEAVRAFHEHCAPLVAKLLTPLSISMDQASLFVHTRAVEASDLAHLEGLAVSPMLFQQRIEKALELRVAMVQGRAFTGAIDARQSAAGQVDWRLARPDEVAWKPFQLPAEIERRLASLLGDLGLIYGAIDLILTPEGEFVFLEVNPSGEWGMLEMELGLPIGDALAEALVEASAP